MKLVYDSNVKNYEDEYGSYSERLYIFECDDEEKEDFELLSHNEKIAELELEKENSTPSKEHGAVIRYGIDDSSMSNFIIVTESVTRW